MKINYKQTTKMNPTALFFWIFLGIIGYLFDGTTGALVGVAVGLFLSLLAEAL